MNSISSACARLLKISVEKCSTERFSSPVGSKDLSKNISLWRLFRISVLSEVCYLVIWFVKIPIIVSSVGWWMFPWTKTGLQPVDSGVQFLQSDPPELGKTGTTIAIKFKRNVWLKIIFGILFGKLMTMFFYGLTDIVGPITESLVELFYKLFSERNIGCQQANTNGLPVKSTHSRARS